MLRDLLLATTFLAMAATAQAAQQAVVVGVFDNNVGFADAVQMPNLITTYVDSTLEMSEWVASAGYACQQVAVIAGQLGIDPSKLTPLLGLPMAGAGQDADTAFKYLASGQGDSMLTKMFQSCAGAGYKAFYIRPGFEMNGGWFSWSVTPANAADWNAAFAHVADLAHGMTSQGILIEVVWNPNVGPFKTAVKDQYPGNQYVDVIGLDLYGAPIYNDAAPLDPASAPSDTNLTLAGAMQFAAANGKLFALPETGSASAAFVNNLTQGLLAGKTDIAFVSVWDSDAGGCPGCTIGVGSDKATAWKNLISSVKNQTAPAPPSSAGTGSVVAVLPSGGSSNGVAPGDGSATGGQSAMPTIPASNSNSNINNDSTIVQLEGEITQLEANITALEAQIPAAVTNAAVTATVAAGSTGDSASTAGNADAAAAMQTIKHQVATQANDAAGHVICPDDGP